MDAVVEITVVTAKTCRITQIKEGHLPLFAHLALVLAAGIYLPGPLVAWFQNVARLLG